MPEIINSAPSIIDIAFVAPALVVKENPLILLCVAVISVVAAEKILSAWPGETVYAFWLERRTTPAIAVESPVVASPSSALAVLVKVSAALPPAPVTPLALPLFP